MNCFYHEETRRNHEETRRVQIIDKSKDFYNASAAFSIFVSSVTILSVMQFVRRNVQFIIPGMLLLIFGTFSLLSDGYYGGADNISHYLISHYSFRHPVLFLNAWGRPLYTMLSAPFAQAGLQGAKLLNVMLGTGTAYLAFRVAVLLNIRKAPAAMIFVCFTPLYFVMMPTALTEILFSFILVLTVLLFLQGRYVFSAIILSFIPFARTEGYFLLPLFAVVMWWFRHPRAIPYLATGIVVFSLAGAFHFRDLFWVFNQFPYPVSYHHPIYNKTGSPWHFLQARDVILGLPLEILFVAGLAGIMRDLVSTEQTLRKSAKQITFLIFAPFLLYFALHSFLYWQALGGSMGLDRVMAAVLPLAALISLKGFDDLAGIFRGSRMLHLFLTIVVPGCVIAAPFLVYPAVYPLTPEEVTIRKATGWLKSSPYAGRLLFYTDNNVPYYMKADPFRNPAECRLFGDSKYLDTIPAGSVMIWDAHFGANESKIPVDSLLCNDRQRVINYLRPAKPWMTFGGGFYDCYITVTIQPGEKAENYAIRDSIMEVMDARNTYKMVYLNTFENPGDTWDPALLSGDTVHRGTKSYRMDARTEYSPGICMKVSELPFHADTTEIRASVYINIPLVLKSQNTLLVISFEHRNKPYSYSAVNLNDMAVQQGKWHRVSLTVKPPKFFSQDDIVKMYIWNLAKQGFYIDDLTVELVSTNYPIFAHSP